MFIRFFFGLWRQPKFIVQLMLPVFFLILGFVITANYSKKANDPQNAAQYAAVNKALYFRLIYKIGWLF